MTPAEIMAATAVVVGAINFIVLVIGGTWKASRIEISLRESFTTALGTHRREIDDEIDRGRREFGETASALRQKIIDVGDRITQVEFYLRDNFVRKESFDQTTRGLAESLRAFRDELKTHIEKLDGKLDRIAERNDRRDAREDGRG